MANPVQEAGVAAGHDVAAGPDRAVSVWRWTGWTFSLIWRSDPGDYHDLVLAGQDHGPPILSLAGQ